MSANLSLVVEVFALLFSSRWLTHWHKQWQQQQGVKPRRHGQKSPKAGRPGREKNPAPQRFYQRVFSLRVTLWYLIFQRAHSDHTLAAVVVDLRRGGADRLGRKGSQRLSRKVRSTNTSAYSQARQRLPLELLCAALAHLRQGLLKLVDLAPAPKKKPAPDRRTRQILDGSTLAALLTPALAEAYPAATNQSGASDWCLLRIVVGFCARSGAVLSAIEGALQESEQALSWALMAASAAFTIWVGDRNFGVWSVAAKAVHCRQDVLVRLTRVRAAKLCHGQPLLSGQERLVQWSPSRHDQTPPGTRREPISGRLLYVRLSKEGKFIDLWLFTTLESDAYGLALLVKWYAQRWQAEAHFRSVKTQMQMAQICVGTPEMARKEFYAGLLAYSLVRAVMWQAGERLETGVAVLSFNNARRVLCQYLQEWAQTTCPSEPWSRDLVAEVAQHSLPKRRKKRPTEIRRVRQRRLRFPPLRGSRTAARARDLNMKSS